MREVIYSEYERQEKEGERPIYVLVEKGHAIFHTFGIDCQEYEHGVGTFTTAIIELSDGSMNNLPVEQVRFVV